MADLKTLTVCDNPFMANLVETTLKDNGIACIVLDQTLTGVQGGYGPMPGYAIRVYAKDEERARELIENIINKRDENTNE